MELVPFGSNLLPTILLIHFNDSFGAAAEMILNSSNLNLIRLCTSGRLNMDIEENYRACENGNVGGIQGHEVVQVLHVVELDVRSVF